EDGIRDRTVTGVQTCALPIFTGVPDGTGARDGRDRPGGVDPADPVVVVVSDEQVPGPVHGDTRRVLQLGRGGETAVSAESRRPEIGRASCRERLWVSGRGGSW